MAKPHYKLDFLIILIAIASAGLIMAGVDLLNVRAQDSRIYMPQTFNIEDYDKNRDGIIDADELSLYTLHKWDQNLDGLIDRSEFSDGVFSWYAPFTDKYPSDFSLWDFDGNGGLTFDDIQRLLTETNYQTYWDFDGDGVLGNGEVADSLYRIFEYDRAGQVTPYEWEIFLD